MSTGRWDRKTFTAKLRKVGESYYHDRHPFHELMNSGRLGREDLRAWVANRFYYQLKIPIKDAAILSNCPLREVRRVWLHRIVDHDGEKGDEGGIGAWLRLGQACGLTRGELLDSRQVIPGVRFAVDAYVNFARTQPWPMPAVKVVLHIICCVRGASGGILPAASPMPRPVERPRPNRSNQSEMPTNPSRSAMVSK